MITISIIVIVSLIVAVIAYTIGAINNTTQLPHCCLTCLHDHRHDMSHPFMGGVCCDHYGISSLRRKIDDLNTANMVLERQMREIRFNAEMQARPIFYAKSIPEQETVDLLKTGLKPLNELGVKLGIKE